MGMQGVNVLMTEKDSQYLEEKMNPIPSPLIGLSM